MSVEHVTGNLLDFTTWNVALHIVSRQYVMGAGLAKQIKEEFPAAYDAYKAAFSKEKDGTLVAPPLGSLIPAEVMAGKRVVNAVAQDGIGTDKRQLDYEALYVCLEQMERLLREAAADGRNWVLGLPHGLGCGLAGGALPVVEAMIHHIFDTSPIRCVIVQRIVKPAALAQQPTLTP